MLRLLPVPALLLLLACPPKNDTGKDGPPEGDADSDTDADTDSDTDADTDTVSVPSVHIEVTRADDSTAFPPVAVTVTASDAAGEPWEGDVYLSALTYGHRYDPEVDPLTMEEPGTWTTTVRYERSGEVELSASAHIDGCHQYDQATVLFLPFVDPSWDVPLALEGVNTLTAEDSISVSPDGETLFFSYTPLKGCNYMPAGYGDPPYIEACSVPVGPIDSELRPCAHGLNEWGLVSEGLFGDTGLWPWAKAMMSSYALTRQADGTFGEAVCISFDDDGTLMEVSPTSGPASPVPGEAYDLFFAYPDWLDVDPDHDGSVYAVATVTAGESVTLSDPITAFSSPPGSLLPRPLTGPMNDLRESAEVVGEFRVFDDPDAGPQLWFEVQQNVGDPGTIVVSTLTGIYPEGDWGEATALPEPVNTGDHHETFPWPGLLDDGEGPVRHLFFNRGPLTAWTAPTTIEESVYSGGAWGEPATLLAPEISGEPGSIALLALPSVSEGAHGVELFFVYVLLDDDGDVNLQVGVAERR